MILQQPFAIGSHGHGPIYYSPVTVDHTKVISTQTDFPVLVSQTNARFKTVGNSGHVQNANGFDIRPYSGSGLSSALTYELERYNASTGEVVMWVKVASLSSVTDTVIYLRYGDASITTDGSSTATWSNGFLGVYHLKDGTTLSVNSATGSNNGTNHSVTATAGKIDGGGGFVSASSQYVDLGTGMNPSAALTLSIWVNATSLPGAYNTTIARAVSAANQAQLLVKSNGKLECSIGISTTGNVGYDGTGTNTLSTGTWYLLHMKYDQLTHLIGYVNGSVDGSNTAGLGNGIVATPCSTYIGQYPAGGGSFWNGSLDEVRFSDVARSADWITTEFNNQNAPGTFETLGAEV